MRVYALRCARVCVGVRVCAAVRVGVRVCTYACDTCAWVRLRVRGRAYVRLRVGAGLRVRVWARVGGGPF